MALTKVSKKVSKLSAADVGALAVGAKAADAALLEGSNKQSIINTAKAGLVPEGRTVNGLALNQNISLNAGHVGALAAGGKAADSALLEGKNKGQIVAESRAGLVPESRTVNGLALNANISLTPANIGAAPASHSHDYVPNAQKGANGGVATLDSSGKIPQSQIPAIAINEVFTSANEAGMLALNAQIGDICRRTDNKKTYILTATPATQIANWLEIFTPDSAVTSVNGEVGNVTLDAAKVGALPASGTAVNAAKLENSTKTDIINAAKSGLVPDVRTVNGLRLNANISLNAGHVGALPAGGKAADSSLLEGKTKAQVVAESRAGLVPDGRTVNGLALNQNISLNAGHVGALASGATAVNSSKLENATKAQVISEARNGLAAIGLSYTKAESDAKYALKSELQSTIKKHDIVLSAATNKISISPLSALLFLTVGGVVQQSDAYSLLSGQVTFTETLDASEVITLIGF